LNLVKRHVVCQHWVANSFSSKNVSKEEYL